MDPLFWRNKKVLLTGHTGFKGSWLAIWLKKMGAEVIGLALEPPTEPSLFEAADVGAGMTSIIGDIRDLAVVVDTLKAHQPEIIIHLAAQSLVRRSYKEPVETYATNVMGTLHVLEGIRSVDSVRAAVMVTTDKCYENKEKLQPYREDEPMGGADPYSSSKGCAELLIASYRSSYFSSADTGAYSSAIASARAGNVVGGGDWAEDRLVPDILTAFDASKPVRIRNPNSIRPWQHVLEPLAGYLVLAQKLYENGAEFAEGWNFGPDENDARTVQWIVEKMAEKWGQGASWEIDEGDHPHEANYLKLDSSKARDLLGWRPQWALETTLNNIVEWYFGYHEGQNLRQLCEKQISAYSSAEQL